METSELMKLQDAIGSVFFPELQSDGFKMYDRGNINRLVKKSGTTLDAAMDAYDEGDFAVALDANVVSIIFDRTPDGIELYASVYDTNGDLVSKERAVITDDERSWGQLQDMAAKSVAALTAQTADDLEAFKLATQTHNPGG